MHMHGYLHLNRFVALPPLPPAGQWRRDHSPGPLRALFIMQELKSKQEQLPSVVAQALHEHAPDLCCCAEEAEERPSVATTQPDDSSHRAGDNGSVGQTPVSSSSSALGHTRPLQTASGGTAADGPAAAAPTGSAGSSRRPTGHDGHFGVPGLTITSFHLEQLRRSKQASLLRAPPLRMHLCLAHHHPCCALYCTTVEVLGAALWVGT